MRLSIHIDSATTDDVRHLAATAAIALRHAPPSLWDHPGMIAAGCDGPGFWKAATPPMKATRPELVLALRAFADYLEGTPPR